MSLIDRERVAKDEAYKNQMRRKCQDPKHLLFLGRLLGYTKLNDEIHGPVITQGIVLPKDPDVAPEDWSTVKQRLQFDPRHTYKSTVSIIDSVQTIICNANIRICKLTATKPLANAIANEIRDHFICSAIAEPSDFQLLFPEFVIPPSAAREGEYTAPCRTRAWRERTVMSFSNETSISGWHFDIIDCDDVVDTNNSATPQGLKKVKKNWYINKKTLNPGGYVNYKATIYDPFDLGCEMIEKAKPGKVKLLIRAALRMKDGRRLEPGPFPKASEMVLLFPSILSYAFLKDEFENNYESFMTQYMNDSHGGHEVIFPKELMLQATVPADQVPITGEVSITVRLPYGKSDATRYAAITVGLLAGGRLFVVDGSNGTFPDSALAHKIVKMAKRYGAHTVRIESTPGARYFESAIQNYALTLSWKLDIIWLEFEEDEAIRDRRMKAMEPLITAQRLLISSGMENLAALYKQFTNYGMVDEAEIPDAISRLAEALPRSIALEHNDETGDQDLAWLLAQERDIHDRVHGAGAYAPAAPVEKEPEPEPIVNSYGLPNELGGLNG